MAKSWTITTTTNSDGSVTYSANGNSVTVNNNWTYSYSSSSWKTWSWSVSWWSNAASSFNSTYWSWSSISSNGSWWWTVNNSSSSGGWSSSWGGWSSSWGGWSWCNYNLTWERYTDWNEVANWASPDIAWTSAPNQSTWWTNDPTWWKPQSAYSWWWWGWSVNWEQQKYPEYPQYPQKDYPDYSWQFEWIKNYINSLSWDLSWMKDLMEKNNTMFQSKLDAQMQAQKEMENKFNAERSKIEWKMDENTREQKARLDQMEQRYTESLNKTQEMLEEYYSSTREVLERRASSATAAAASELWAKWLNSAVIENTAEGKRLQMQDAINQQIKANAEMQQQLNNDYADFMQQIFNNHDTLNQNQIKLLQEGLKMKQEYRQQENDLVNSYIDNVYKPMENHLSKLAETYTDRADAAYKNERAVAEYKWMSTAARTRDIMNRLIAMVWDGNLETLSEQDLNLISQIASRSDINSTEEAIAVLLKAAQKSGDSDIINAVSTAQRNWTWNVNPGSTSNPGGTNNPGWNGTEWEWNGWDNTEATEDDNWLWLNYTIKNIDELRKIINDMYKKNTKWWAAAELGEIWEWIKKDINTIQAMPQSPERDKLLWLYKQASDYMRAEVTQQQNTPTKNYLSADFSQKLSNQYDNQLTDLLNSNKSSKQINRQLTNDLKVLNQNKTKISDALMKETDPLTKAYYAEWIDRVNKMIKKYQDALANYQ